MSIRTTRDAKRPLTAAAGPYGHPFHPILVTIPIGAWVCALVFDICTYISGGSRPLTDAAYWLIAIGVVSAVVAALFGLLDLLTIPRGSDAMRTGLTHMTLNLLIVAAFVVDFLWRHGSYYEAAQPKVGQVILSAVAIAALLVSGWLGGKMTYRYGVRVAREQEQAQGLRARRAA